MQFSHFDEEWLWVSSKLKSREAENHEFNVKIYKALN